MAYALRCSIQAHTNDVRALTVIENLIVSGSRDRRVKLWTESGLAYQETSQVTFHSHFVSSLCAFPPSETFPEGLVFSGGHDSIIVGFAPFGSEPKMILSGHAGPVCCLGSSMNGKLLLSSSWDNTAKVWNISKGECLTTLYGHEGTVWAVMSMPMNNVVTGSADKLIRVFAKDGSLLKSLSAHTDCVRGLSRVDNDLFLSCSNDGTVRKWSLSQGVAVKVFYCHDSFIYGLAALSGTVACGCEDNTLIIWSDEELDKDIIKLPSTSVWSVAILPNSDVVTGNSDGYIRIFTKDQSRMASEEKVAEYKLEFLSSSSEGQGSTLPGNESFHSNSGTSDGEIKLVRRNDKTYCYSWSGGSNRWIFIGEQCSSPPSKEDSEAQPEICYPPKKCITFENYDLKLIFKRVEEFMRQMDYTQPDIQSSLNLCENLFISGSIEEIKNALQVLIRSISEWPECFVYPLLDVIRIGTLNSRVQSILFDAGNQSELMSALERFIKADSLTNNKMFLFRIFSNMLSTERGEEVVFSRSEYLLEKLPGLVIEKHKGLEIAASTFILNMSGASLRKGDTASSRLCSEALRELIGKISDPEASFRLVASVGTLAKVQPTLVSSDCFLQFLTRVSKWEKEDRSKKNAAYSANLILQELHLHKS